MAKPIEIITPKTNSGSQNFLLEALQTIPDHAIYGTVRWKAATGKDLDVAKRAVLTSTYHNPRSEDGHFQSKLEIRSRWGDTASAEDKNEMVAALLRGARPEDLVFKLSAAHNIKEGVAKMLELITQASTRVAYRIQLGSFIYDLAGDMSAPSYSHYVVLGAGVSSDILDQDASHLNGGFHYGREKLPTRLNGVYYVAGRSPLQSERKKAITNWIKGITP